MGATLRAAIIYGDFQNATITTAQLVGAAVVALVLLTAALAIPRQAAPAPGQAPAWWPVGVVCLLILAYRRPQA